MNLIWLIYSCLSCYSLNTSTIYIISFSIAGLAKSFLGYNSHLLEHASLDHDAIKSAPVFRTWLFEIGYNTSWDTKRYCLSTSFNADLKLHHWKLRLHYVLGSVSYHSKVEDLMALDHRRKSKNVFTTSIQHLARTLPPLSSPMIFRRSRN